MEGQYIALRDKASHESVVSDKTGPTVDEAFGVQKKGGKPGQWLYVPLVIFAIIAVSAVVTTVALAITLGVRSSQPQAQTGPTTTAMSPTTSPTTSPTMFPTTPPDSGSSTCLTQGCVQLAAQIISAMNQSVNPCEDFYQFSCGNWGQRNLIPPDNIVEDQFSKPRRTVYQRLADIVENGDDGGVEAVGKAFDLYRSCMDAATIENLGVTPLLDVIRNSLGGWPLIGIPETSPWSINSSFFFYEKAHGSLAFFNLRPFFNAVTMNRSKYALHFEQQLTTLLSPPTNITSSIITSYVSILSRFNPLVNPTVNAEAIQSMLEFDQRLYEILEPPSKVPNIVNGDAVPLLNESNIYTLEHLQTLWPEFDWEAFINYIYIDLSGLDVPQNLEIVVTTPGYFQRLGQLLQNTNQEVVRDYAKALFLIRNVQSLSSQFARFRNRLTDPTPGDLTSCMMFVERTLPIALARPFVERLVPEGTKEKIMMMMDYILQSFRERVNQMDWLSDLSKQRSIEKVNEIITQAAFPMEIFDNDYVNGIYSRFIANSSDYFGNRLRATELSLHLCLNATHGFDKTMWPTVPDFDVFPTQVNAFYTRQTNQIFVMAAIANEPFSRVDWPDYAMFGSLGSIVGHEITHGFDSNGQQYDKDGVRRMWWSSESQTEFNSRLQCFIDQYNQYIFEGVQVNGNRSLPENIADNGGLHASFKAYQMRAAASPQQRLPSLPYTPEQLFFVTYGQTWCELALPSYYQFQRDNDRHAPGPARARAVVNSPEFAEAFNCPAGSPMNPANKCIIW